MVGRTLWRRLGAVVAVGALAGCAGGSGEDRTVQVLAAASLTETFTELGESFEASHAGVDVELALGSSTDLAEQAADGAPGDVLATADEAAMTIATDAGVVAGPATFATNVLVVVTPPDDPAGIGSLADLDGTTWVRCADQAPCGRAARTLLDDAGLPDDPASLEEDVRATLDKVTAGEADAALVYATDAASAGDAVRTVPVDGAGSVRNTYRIGALEQSGEPELAQRWIAHVTGPEGRTALENAGFSLP